MNQNDTQADEVDHSYSGRIGWKCECGRVISIYDRVFHRRNICPVHTDTEQ